MHVICSQTKFDIRFAPHAVHSTISRNKFPTFQGILKGQIAPRCTRAKPSTLSGTMDGRTARTAAKPSPTAKCRTKAGQHTVPLFARCRKGCARQMPCPYTQTHTLNIVRSEGCGDHYKMLARSVGKRRARPASCTPIRLSTTLAQQKSLRVANVTLPPSSLVL